MGACCGGRQPCEVGSGGQQGLGCAGPLPAWLTRSEAPRRAPGSPRWRRQVAPSVTEADPAHTARFPRPGRPWQRRWGGGLAPPCGSLPAVLGCGAEPPRLGGWPCSQPGSALGPFTTEPPTPPGKRSPRGPRRCWDGTRGDGAASWWAPPTQEARLQGPSWPGGGAPSQAVFRPLTPALHAHVPHQAPPARRPPSLELPGAPHPAAPSSDPAHLPANPPAHG